MLTTTDSWLPLAEYSLKHQVSISTLRRRIKSEEIKFKFDDGKYLILDESAKKQIKAEEHRPSHLSETQKNSAPQTTDSTTSFAVEPGESVISAANKLLSDLKKAYTQILHEKEEQILQLREETMDLKTLIKVLEAENARLRGN